MVLLCLKACLVIYLRFLNNKSNSMNKISLKTININRCKNFTFFYFFLLLVICNTNLLATNATNISQEDKIQNNTQKLVHEIYVKYITETNLLESTVSINVYLLNLYFVFLSS